MSETGVNPVTAVEGRGIPLRGDEIDTDRIIPARYLKCVTFEGIGEFAFYDERFDEGGNNKDHPFNDSRYVGGSILIVNRNFGCGSSREHAPQALRDFGVRGIIGESFAEIFAGNCTSLGIPALTLPGEHISELQELVERQPERVIQIDLNSGTLSAEDREYRFSIPEPTKKALTMGTWDSTRVLLGNKPEIERTFASIQYLTGFR